MSTMRSWTMISRGEWRQQLGVRERIVLRQVNSGHSPLVRPPNATMSTMRSWTMVNHGEWRRSLGVRERMVLRLVDTTRPGHFPGTITVALRLDHAFGDFARRSETAWRALRYMHPSIAATVEGDDVVYRVASGAVADKWVRRTFRVHNTDCDAATLYPQLDGANECRLHVLPSSNEIMLEGPHWILDGVGMLLLLNDLCRLIVSPPLQDGDESKALSPTLEEAAAIPPAPDVSWQRARELVSGWSANRNEAICIRTATDAGGQVGPFSRMRTVLSSTDTNAIRSLARSKELSITHITHAALIAAAMRHSPAEGERRHWCGGLPINARRWCSPSYAAGLYFVGVPCIVEEPQGLMDAAQKLKARYREWQEGRDALHLLEPLEQLTKPPQAAADMDGPAFPMYSGLGEVERVIRVPDQSLQIRDFWLAMRNISPRVVGLHCYTVCGRLGLDASFNPTYHTDRSIGQLLRGMTDALMEAVCEEGVSPDL